MSILLYAKRIYFSPHTDKLVISLENLNQAGVYALICMETNKVYIGSSIKLGARLLDYMQPAYLGSRPNSPLIRAIIKYGYINFCFTVLETCKPYEVLEREQYWLDLISPEYNLSPTAGSTLGVALSEETKAKIGAARKGQTHSLETCLLMSETRKGSNNPMFGKNPSEETRAKMSAALPKKLPNKLLPAFAIAAPNTAPNGPPNIPPIIPPIPIAPAAPVKVCPTLEILSATDFSALLSK